MAASTYSPSTRWCGGNPFDAMRTPAAIAAAPAQLAGGRRVARAGLACDTRSALLAHLEQSLDRGYWRVALRRFLMILARGDDVPSSTRMRCEAWIARLPARELDRMRSDVQQLVQRPR